MASEREKALRAEQFTTAREVQPWWYRATNGVGRALPSFGMPSADAWFAKAKRQNPGVGDPRPETLAALEDSGVESFSDLAAAAQALIAEVDE